MSTRPDDFETWTLAHAWHSDSDKAALEVCAAELAGIGIRFAGTSNAATANAVKMHGFEIVDALRAATLQLADLRSIAARQDWDTRVDPRALRFMRHGERMFGIPLNIHQSN